MNIFEIVFVNIANIEGERTLQEKRTRTVITMAAISCFYIHSLLCFISWNYFDLVGWLSKFWPWESDNVRSFKNVGFMYVLLIGIPAGIFWWRVSKRCLSEIRMLENTGYAFSLYMVWGMFQTVGAALISILLRQPLLAFCLQTLAFVALAEWYRRHPVGGHSTQP